MKEYDIYSEGYICTGQSGRAEYHGTIKAKTFKDACREFFKGDIYYNAKENTYWGCYLFDNMKDARKSFG